MRHNGVIIMITVQTSLLGISYRPFSGRDCERTISRALLEGPEVYSRRVAGSFPSLKARGSGFCARTGKPSIRQSRFDSGNQTPERLGMSVDMPAEDLVHGFYSVVFVRPNC